MTELYRLKLIIDSLSDFEKECVVKLFFVNENFEESHFTSIKLIKTLLDKNQFDLDKLYIDLYGKVNVAALKKLVQRVSDRILDLLISKEVLFKSDIYDNKAREIFNIKRKLFHYDVLVAHGLSNYALTILNQVIKSASKLEYYDYLVVALEKKLIKMSLKNGVNEYKKVYKYISFYTECNLALKNAQYLLRLYSSDYDYNQKVINLKNLETSIHQIEKDFKKTNSKSIFIVLCYIKCVFYSSSEKYYISRNIFIELYQYLIKNQGVVFRTYKLNCLVNIAECEILTMNFSSSIKTLLKLMDQYERNEYNNKLIIEMFFLNYYYLGNIDKAIEKVNLLVNVKAKSAISNFLISKWKFYLAAILTINGTYQESNKVLLQCKSLEKDKDGWNLGIRLLQIVNNIDLDKLIFVESQVENLRKHIDRIIVKSKYIERCKVILKVLIVLINNSFDFKVTAVKCKSELLKLGSSNNIYSWKLKSPEMILFHEWFDAKVKGIPYNHVEVMARLKKLNKALK